MNVVAGTGHIAAGAGCFDDRILRSPTTAAHRPPA